MLGGVKSNLFIGSGCNPLSVFCTKFTVHFLIMKFNLIKVTIELKILLAAILSGD